MTIEIVPLNDLPKDVAKTIILGYIGSRKVQNRKVYISEIVEKFRLDMELVAEIMEELKQKR